MSRSQVIWFGRPAVEDEFREFGQRGLALRCLPRDGTPEIEFARACVFWATRPHFPEAIAALKEWAVEMADAGLLLFVVVENEEQLLDTRRVLQAVLPDFDNSNLHVKLRMTLATSPVAAHEPAQAALMHDPGPSARAALEIVLPSGLKLGLQDVRLLQRAFHDCTRIELSPLGGGLSGADTFQVAATLIDSNAGSHPQPFFAKLGDKAKLRDELQRFRQYAEHHIAFYLRPNFLSARHILGVTRGVLVGNFVPGSISLWEAVRAGDGAAHIRSLFEDTLGALRDEHPRNLMNAAETVVGQLDPFCAYAGVPSARVEAASDFGGLVLAPDALWRELLNLPNHRWRHSAIHGDMHGENVRIRKQDAIVIDFAHATTGPMSADLASLEVWLSLRAPFENDASRAAWQVDMAHAYSLAGIEVTVAGTTQPRFEKCSWLEECVAELRRQARGSTVSAEEYARVLAVFLIRAAVYPPWDEDPINDEVRRTYAYWLANRLVDDLRDAAERERAA